MLEFQRWYGVRAARVATFLPVTETWDTSVVVPNLSGIKFTPMMDNDEMMIYGSLEHMLSVFKGMTVDLDFGGVDNASANAMTGMSSTASGSGDGETRRKGYEGGDDLAYFGLIAQIVSQGGGDVHFMLPRLKLDTYFPFEFSKESKFAIPNVGAKGAQLRLADDTLYKVLDMLEHVVVTAVPSNFATAFAASVIS